MKKYFFLLFVLTTISSFSQTNYSAISMKNDAEYKAADKYALEASNYILSGPMDKNNPKQQAAIQFMLKWMDGTPDYTFSIDADISTKVMSGNEDLLGLYMASMTKYCLENKANAGDGKLVKLNAMKILIAYAEKTENKVAISKSFQTLIEANRRGALEKELQ